MVNDMANTSWIKDGKKIIGEYCGVKYSGIVSNTRVCYGTDIQYTVVLDKPIEVFGDPRERILVRKEANLGQYTFI
jgi:hypothetical protein